jgi:hypothetical protein
MLPMEERQIMAMEPTDAEVEPCQTDGFVLRKALFDGLEGGLSAPGDIATNIFAREDAEGPLDHQISSHWLRRLRRRSQRYRLIYSGT